MLVEPLENSLARFFRETTTMRGGGKYPADFSLACERRVAIPEEVEKADMTDGGVVTSTSHRPHADAGQLPQGRSREHAPPGILAAARAANMAAGLGVSKKVQEVWQVAQLEPAQHQAFRFYAWSRRESVRRIVKRKQVCACLFLAEGQPAEALVEARDLAALLDLPRAAGPRRVHLRVDLEVQRVAFLAPRRVGH